MNKIKIRFNKTRGKEGRGSLDHVWRVFEGDKEYLVKGFVLNVPSKGEKEELTEDWNVVCDGILSLDRENSIAIINNN